MTWTTADVQIFFSELPPNLSQEEEHGLLSVQIFVSKLPLNLSQEEEAVSPVKSVLASFGTQVSSNISHQSQIF